MRARSAIQCRAWGLRKHKACGARARAYACRCASAWTRTRRGGATRAAAARRLTSRPIDKQGVVRSRAAVVAATRARRGRGAAVAEQSRARWRGGARAVLRAQEAAHPRAPLSLTRWMRREERGGRARSVRIAHAPRPPLRTSETISTAIVATARLVHSGSPSAQRTLATRPPSLSTMQVRRRAGATRVGASRAGASPRAVRALASAQRSSAPREHAPRCRPPLTRSPLPPPSVARARASRVATSCTPPPSSASARFSAR